MTFLSGVDGCKTGWLAITKNIINGWIESKILLTVENLVDEEILPQIIAIDIPIGLTEMRQRECDRLARQLLSQPRQSSVFPAPIRPSLSSSSREEASQITKSIDGRGVGVQAWGLYEKIHDNDQLLITHPLLRRILYEVHPELSFMAWNEGVAISDNKKTPEGKSARTGLVISHFGDDAFQNVREEHRRGLVADDDINDAFAALWTAKRIYYGTYQVIPNPPDIDSMGLQIAMWY